MRLLALLLISLGGCTDWHSSVVRSALLEKHPDCELTSWVLGDGDSDHFYAQVEMNCTNGGKQIGEVLFRKGKTDWSMVWEEMN